MLWEAVLDDLSKPNFPPQKLIKFFTKPLVGRQCYKLCLALLKLPSAEFAHASLPLYTCRKVYCAIGACLAISEEYWLCWWCPPIAGGWVQLLSSPCSPLCYKHKLSCKSALLTSTANQSAFSCRLNQHRPQNLKKTDVRNACNAENL